jgi:hypothetical protein
MTPAATSALITQVELALLADRNLEQIEIEILESGEGDEELRTAAWLYVWSCTDGRPLATSAYGSATEICAVVPTCVPVDGTSEHRATIEVVEPGAAPDRARANRDNPILG